MQIKRDREARLCTIDQTIYISEVLRKFYMEDAHGTSTPIAARIELDKPSKPASLEEKREVEKLPYKQDVGSLIFFGMPDKARPGLCCASCIAIYVRLQDGTLDQVKCIMRYIKQTAHSKIRYHRGQGMLNLEGISDSDWAADQISRKSLDSYIFIFARGPVSCACK